MDLLLCLEIKVKPGVGMKTVSLGQSKQSGLRRRDKYNVIVIADENLTQE